MTSYSYSYVYLYNIFPIRQPMGSTNSYGQNLSISFHLGDNVSKQIASRVWQFYN